MMDFLITFKEKEFNEFIKSKNNGLIIFSAPWCASCRVVTPIIESIAKNYKKIKFIKIDVSESAGLASRMGVMSLPNIIFIKKGKVYDQIIGSATKKNLEEKIKKLES